MNIKNSCEFELEQISEIVNGLKENRVTEISRAQMDGTVSHNGQKLEKYLLDALNKIQKDIDDSVEKFDSLI